MQPRSQWFVSAAVLVLLLVTPTAAKKSKNRPFTIVPGIGSVSKIAGGLERIRVDRKGLATEFSFVIGVARRKMMEVNLGLEGDVFATPSGVTVRFNTFLVYMHNQSGKELHFNPSTSRIITNRGQHIYAIDYTRLFELFNEHLTMDQISKITFDRPFALQPGGKERKLLVFEQIPGDSWEEFVIKLSLESDGKSEYDLTVPFRKLYLEQPSP